jgi:hypothetical protein
MDWVDHYIFSFLLQLVILQLRLLLLLLLFNVNVIIVFIVINYYLILFLLLSSLLLLVFYRPLPTSYFDSLSEALRWKSALQLSTEPSMLLKQEESLYILL